MLQRYQDCKIESLCFLDFLLKSYIFQAAFFYLPYKVWHSLEGGLIASFGTDGKTPVIIRKQQHVAYTNYMGEIIIIGIPSGTPYLCNFIGDLQILIGEHSIFIGHPKFLSETLKFGKKTIKYSSL